MSSALHGSAVGCAQLLYAEQSDDFLQLTVMSYGFTDILSGAVVLPADNPWIQQARCRRERVHGGIHALACHTARQDDRGIEVTEDLGNRRIGEIVGWDVDRLDRGDRGPGDRRNALLKLGDLAR